MISQLEAGVRGTWSLEVTKARFKSARARPTHRPRGRRGAVRDTAEIIRDALYQLCLVPARGRACANVNEGAAGRRTAEAVLGRRCCQLWTVKVSPSTACRRSRPS
jgi:hypothetical protein